MVCCCSLSWVSCCLTFYLAYLRRASRELYCCCEVTYSSYSWHYNSELSCSLCCATLFSCLFWVKASWRANYSDLSRLSAVYRSPSNSYFCAASASSPSSPNSLNYNSCFLASCLLNSLTLTIHYSRSFACSSNRFRRSACHSPASLWCSTSASLSWLPNSLRLVCWSSSYLFALTRVVCSSSPYIMM